MKIDDFKFGDMITWKGPFAKANGFEKMVVIAIQPLNGSNGSIVCVTEQNPFDLIVCGPNQVKKT